MRRRHIARQGRTHWFFSLVRAAVLAVVGYFVAALLYLLLLHVSQSPHGPLWDRQFEGPFLFVMLVVVVGVFAVPFFQKEWDTGLRTFSIFTGCFIVAFAVFHSSGFVDMEAPLGYVITHVVEPFRRTIGY